MTIVLKNNVLINEDAKIFQSLVKLNDVSVKCLIVLGANKKVKGTLTDGDIRRAFLKNKNHNFTIKEVYNKNFRFFYETKYNLKKIESILKNKKNHIDVIPILNKNKTLNRLFTLENFINKSEIFKKEIKDTKVIIMAGGLGTRLLPLSKNIPKPLIKFKEKTFLEIILENFFIQGFKSFGITLFHKKKMILAYLKKIDKYKVEPLSENRPLGTAGGLVKFKKIKKKYIIVTNCDNFYKINYLDLLKYHKKYKYDFTIVASKRTLKLPYGICKMINEKFIGLVEKPE